MQQKLIDLNQQQNPIYLACLKAEVDKKDADKLKAIPDDVRNLKSKEDKLNIDTLALVPLDLSKLSNVTKNDVAKKDACNAKIKNIEDKIPDITNLTTKITLNAKINEVTGEIPGINNLAATTALTAIENKIPNVSNLVKKTDYTTKLNETENKVTDHSYDKYITTPKFKRATANIFAGTLP